MRVLLLGAGAMGVTAAETVASFNAVSSLTIADRDGNAANQLATRCGPKAHALSLDVTDETALAAAMAEADLCLNLVGPFFRFGVPILKASIAARTPYIDICDDPEPTLDMLALDADARAAGVMAIVGLGASPGVTNMLAVKAHRALDDVDTLSTMWSVEGDDVDISEEGVTADGKPSAAIIHWLEQCSGKVKVWRSGRLAEADPLVPVNVPAPGRGTRKVWTVGHPEAVTLPRYLNVTDSSLNMMILPPGAADMLLTAKRNIEGGIALEDAAARFIEKVTASEASLFDRLAGTVMGWFSGPDMPLLTAQATGSKGGRAARSSTFINAVPEGGMAGITSIPLAIGARLFAEKRGLSTAPGVFAPEGALDPDVFFAELAPYCDAADAAALVTLEVT